MSQSKGAVRPELPPNRSEATWWFRSGAQPQPWDWARAAPDPRLLKPIRRPTSGATSRHNPVRAFSVTSGDYIELESGLEHDLVRLLDRDEGVEWLVGQPLTLSWSVPGAEDRTHTPDLLSVHSLGQVTVWDVKRPEKAISDEFAVDRAATERACAQVGWSYEIFTGLADAHRHNLIWLHSYRRRPTWADRYEAQLVAIADGGCRLERLIEASEPERSAVAWHLIWAGRIRVDLTSRLTTATEAVS